MKELDKIDFRILKILQQNARIPMTELAEKVGLSSTPVTERVCRLSGNIIFPAITPISIPICWENRHWFCRAEAAIQIGQYFRRFQKEVLKIPQIMECHLVSGEYDYLIKVRLPDMSAYRDMLGNILLQLPAASESRSYVVMEEVKENPVLDLD